MAGFNGRGLFLVLIALAVLMHGLELIPVSLAIALQCVLGSLNVIPQSLYIDFHPGSTLPNCGEGRRFVPTQHSVTPLTTPIS